MVPDCPRPNGPARANSSASEKLNAPAETAPSNNRALSRRANSTAPVRRFFHECAEVAGVEILFQCHPGSHRVSPAFDQNPSCTARRTARPRSTPAIERPEPVPVQLPVPARSQMPDRPNLSFRRAGHQPDHSGVPAFRSGDDHRAFLFQPKGSERFGLGLSDCCLFYLLPFAIETIELGRNSCGLARIFFEEKAHPEIGSPNPAAGVDARPQKKSEMPGLGRTLDARHPSTRWVPDARAAAVRSDLWRQMRG